MSEKRWNPAAVGALLRGDMQNAIIASIPGGIEAQEANGQRDLVRSTKLPIECKYCAREQFELLGIRFGNVIDDLFIEATLPEGWSKVATDHHMWSEVRDERGRVRAAMFYKAAFYDRSAFLTINAFISVRTIFHDEDKTMCMVVRTGDGVDVYESERMRRDDYDTIDRVREKANRWADTHYPDRADPLAYWTAQ